MQHRRELEACLSSLLKREDKMNLRGNLRNFWQTSAGIIASQLVTIAFIPVLSRHYAQELFGQFGFFLSVAVIVSGCASWKLQDAISTVKSRQTAKSLTKVSIFAGAITVIILSPLVLYASNILFSSNELGGYIIMSTASITVANVGMQNLIRERKYKSYSFVIFLLTGSVPLFQIALKYSTLNGLIVGAALSHLLAGIYTILYTTDKILPLKPKFSKREMACFRIFRSYTNFALPNFFLANLRIRMLYFILPSFSSPTYLGIYSQTDRLLGAPTNLLANALRPIATNALIERSSSLGEMLERYLKVQWFSLTPLLAFLVYSSKDLVLLILGRGWINAANIMVILALPAFLMATTQWLDRFYDFTKSHKKVLTLEVFYNIIAVASITYGVRQNSDVNLAVLLFSIAMTCYYFSWLTSLFKTVGHQIAVLFKIISYSTLIFGTTYLTMLLGHLSFLSAAVVAFMLSASIFAGITKSKFSS